MQKILIVAMAVMVAASCAAETFEEKYSDQSVVFLLFDLSVELHDDWSYTTREHKKIKILKEDGKSIGEIPVPFDRSRETVTGLKARTITPDGKVLPYTKIQDITVNEGLAMYSDDVVRMITMPAVSIGSVIEYEVTIHSKGEVMKNQFWFSDDLNSGVPMAELSLTVIVPEKAGIRYKGTNMHHEPEISTEGGRIVYRWRLQDVYTEPAEREDLAPPPRPDDFTNYFEFSSTKSWRDIAAWYHGLVEKNSAPDAAIRDVALGLVEGKGSIRDRTRAILEYVQDNFRYVMMAFGENTLEPHPVSEVFRNKYGDCKDLSLLCAYMLREAGIRANVALFRSEYEATDPQSDLPDPTLFDHVVVEVEDPQGNFYIDPLLKGYDIGQYPANAEGAYTFVITRDGGRFGRFPVLDEKGDYQREDRTMTIRPDGGALVESRSLYGLDTSVGMRQDWQASTDSDKKRFYEYLGGVVAGDGVMLRNEIGGIDARYGPVTTSLKYEKPGMFTVTDGLMIIDVPGFDRDDLFVKKERQKPIFIPYNSRVDKRTVIDMPDGFMIMHLPSSFSEELGLYGLRRTFRREGRRIAVEESEWFRRGEVPASEYGKVRDFISRVAKKSNQRIILKQGVDWRDMPALSRRAAHFMLVSMGVFPRLMWPRPAHSL